MNIRLPHTVTAQWLTERYPALWALDRTKERGSRGRGGAQRPCQCTAPKPIRLAENPLSDSPDRIKTEWLLCTALIL
jgi:hypothetical protein